MKDPGPFRVPQGMNEMSKEMLIDTIIQLVSSLNVLRTLILTLTGPKK